MEQLQKNGAKHCFETVTRRHRCRSTVSTWRPMAWRQPSRRRRCSTARPTSTATAMASYRRCVGERLPTGGSARMSANGLVPHRLTALGIALPSPLFPPLFLPTQQQRVTLHVLVDSPRVSPWPGMPLHEQSFDCASTWSLLRPPTCSLCWQIWPCVSRFEGGHGVAWRHPDRECRVTAMPRNTSVPRASCVTTRPSQHTTPQPAAPRA